VYRESHHETVFNLSVV